MKTSELRDILKSEFSKQVVILEKGVNCESFWAEFTDSCYRDATLEHMNLDGDIKNALTGFAQVDDLSLVNNKGRVLKRFAKYYKESKGEKLADNVMGILGDKLQWFVQKSDAVRSFVVDFTDVFDWEDGQFGKQGSCYWGAYKESIPVLQDNGAFCIRFYESEDDANGIGRMWIVAKDGLLICFNSYGVERPNTSKVIKYIFNKHDVKLHYKAVEVFNSCNGNIPYVNNGTGFILYPEDVTEFRESYDLGMEYEDNLTTCESCNERFDMDNEGSIIHDVCYCDGCANNNFSFCDKCNEYYDLSEVHEAIGRSYSYLCEGCAERCHMALCGDCDKYSEDYFVMQDTGNVYCDGCDNNFNYCETCDEYNENEHEHESEEVES